MRALRVLASLEGPLRKLRFLRSISAAKKAKSALFECRVALVQRFFVRSHSSPHSGSDLSSGESRSITSSHRRVALLCDGCFSYCYALHRDKSEPLCVTSFSSLIIVSQQAPLARVEAHITRSPPRYADGLRGRESELFGHWRKYSAQDSQNDV